MPPVCKIVSVICPFLPTHALPREKAGAADFSGEDSEAEEVVGDAGPREGRKWGAGFSTSGVPGPPVRPEGVKLLRSAITGHQSCDPSPPWCSQQH